MFVSEHSRANTILETQTHLQRKVDDLVIMLVTLDDQIRRLSFIFLRGHGSYLVVRYST